MEAEIETAENAVAALEEKLASPEVSADFSRLQAVMQDHAKAQLRRDELWGEWQRLEAKQQAWAAARRGS
jgi:cell division protein FtsL